MLFNVKRAIFLSVWFDPIGDKTYDLSRTKASAVNITKRVGAEQGQGGWQKLLNRRNDLMCVVFVFPFLFSSCLSVWKTCPHSLSGPHIKLAPPPLTVRNNKLT
jgi:hypothetical protein